MREGEKNLGLFEREAMLTKLPRDAKIIDRGVVERVAAILGEGSMAAKALKRADRHQGQARFWHSSEEGMLWLELLEDRKN